MADSSDAVTHPASAFRRMDTIAATPLGRRVHTNPAFGEPDSDVSSVGRPGRPSD